MVGMGQLRNPASAELIAALRAAGCVYAEEEAAILEESAGSEAHLSSMLARRVRGTPLEHIVGWAEFDGFRVAVAPGVFVPRRRSTFLVDQALGVLALLADPQPVIVDVCCGSGALGAAVARKFAAAQKPAAWRTRQAGRQLPPLQAAPGATPACEVHATDIDPAAVACAAGNLAPWHGQAYCGNLFGPLPARLRGKVGVILANAPYVPADAIDFMPREARLHEPAAALNGGIDGLDVHREIAAHAGQWLRPGGSVLLESSVQQGAASAEILAACGFTSRIVFSDALDCTVAVGVRG